jgi:hypothetical protein
MTARFSVKNRRMITCMNLVMKAPLQRHRSFKYLKEEGNERRKVRKEGKKDGGRKEIEGRKEGQ